VLRRVGDRCGDGAVRVVAPRPFDPVPEMDTIAVEGGVDRITHAFCALRVR
jgi:hypothetical protein